MRRTLRACTALLLISSLALPVAAQFEGPYERLELDGLPKTFVNSVAAIDLGNDQHAELLLTGSNGIRPFTGAYRYDRRDIRLVYDFMAQDSVPVEVLAFVRAPVDFGGISQQLWLGDGRWADIDGDGDTDLAVTGARSLEPPYEPTTRALQLLNGVYQSNASLNASLPQLYASTLAWADVDDDGDTDLSIAGREASGTRTTQVLLQDDDGTFAPTPVGLPGLEQGRLRWADADGDGDPDLALVGSSDEGPIARVYRNDTAGGAVTLTLVADLLGVSNADAAWGDYDGDGDLDLLVVGGGYAPTLIEGVTRVYRNDGGAFVDAGLDLPGIVGGTAAWGDVEGDGDLDVLLVGLPDLTSPPMAFVFRNDGGGAFTRIVRMPGVALGTARWLDFECDGDLDLFLFGQFSGRPEYFVYRYRDSPPGRTADVNTLCVGDEE